MVQSKEPPGPPLTLGNMRQLGVQRLLAPCLNDACHHQGLIDVSRILTTPMSRRSPLRSADALM
jgi:hypothetical protein